MSASAAASWPAGCWRQSRSGTGGRGMANVLLGVTGSVAAILTPSLYAALKRAGHRVRVVATGASLYFFDPAELDPLDPAAPRRNPAVVVLDEDEWPGRGEGRR